MEYVCRAIWRVPAGLPEGTPLTAKGLLHLGKSALRALAWLGPAHAEAALRELSRTLPEGTFAEMLAAAPNLPVWLAKLLRSVSTHG